MFALTVVGSLIRTNGGAAMEALTAANTPGFFYTLLLLPKFIQGLNLIFFLYFVLLLFMFFFIGRILLFMLGH